MEEREQHDNNNKDWILLSSEVESKLEAAKVDKERKKRKKKRGESEHKQPQSMSKFSSSGEPSSEPHNNMIRLIGNRSVHHVSVENFAAVSQLVQKQQQSAKLMTTVDLHRFSDQAILAFISFIMKKEIKTSLTYYALSEMLTLSKTFYHGEFEVSIGKKNILESACVSHSDLLQALIICGVSCVSYETEMALHRLAGQNFVNLAKLPDFSSIPLYQFVQVLGSCDLNVRHEIVVADGALLWLSGQPHPSSCAPAVLGTIRTHFLSQVDKQLIVERINTLHLSERISRLARNMLDSHNGARICMDPTHFKRQLPRCGIAESTPPIGEHSSLPLSRPTNFDAHTANAVKQRADKKKKKTSIEKARTPKVMELMEMSGPGTTSAKPPMLHKTKKSRSERKSRCACVDYIKKKLGTNPEKSDKKHRKTLGRPKTPRSASCTQETCKSEKAKANLRFAKPRVPSPVHANQSSTRTSSKAVGISSASSTEQATERRNEKSKKVSHAISSSKDFPSSKSSSVYK
ncbi:unnamed protein product [Caenorhabditis auriculariae]|uniref:BACK domain-containing protein n=1 Tax=Caenorhabditis auriculariae TaxID=2777116 RepID=A0A8S1H2K9_9PELO|nr:unnamed protein product [Caenorhabditis auriculariae]